MEESSEENPESDGGKEKMDEVEETTDEVAEDTDNEKTEKTVINNFD